MAIDTSVVVPALLSRHEQHDLCRQAAVHTYDALDVDREPLDS